MVISLYVSIDPFVGGGTVVLEAMRSGRLGVGSDISPLALFVSQGRCWTASHSELDGLREVRPWCAVVPCVVVPCVVVHASGGMACLKAFANTLPEYSGGGAQH